MGDEYSRFFERIGIFGKSFSDIAKTPLKALTAQTDSLTFAQKASAAASKLAVGALNLFANVGISFVISFIIS